MNARNVAALTAALEAAWAATFQGVPIPVAQLEAWKGVAPFLAVSLAALGGLMPSVIGTEPDDLIQFDMVIRDEADDHDVQVVDLAKLREALERIAKGEPHPYRTDTGRAAWETAREILEDLEDGS